MPTLRRFIRPSDWDRIEQMFYIASHLPPSEETLGSCGERFPMTIKLWHHFEYIIILKIEWVELDKCSSDKFTSLCSIHISFVSHMQMPCSLRFSKEEQRCFFRKPMFFRLPGESRSCPGVILHGTWWCWCYIAPVASWSWSQLSSK